MRPNAHFGDGDGRASGLLVREEAFEHADRGRGTFWFIYRLPIPNLTRATGSGEQTERKPMNAVLNAHVDGRLRGTHKSHEENCERIRTKSNRISNLDLSVPVLL